MHRVCIDPILLAALPSWPPMVQIKEVSRLIEGEAEGHLLELATHPRGRNFLGHHNHGRDKREGTDQWLRRTQLKLLVFDNSHCRLPS